MGASCFAWRFGDIVSSLSFDEKIGPGFSLQSIGDICGIAAGVTASVLLAKSRTRLGADLTSGTPWSKKCDRPSPPSCPRANSPIRQFANSLIR